MSSVEPISTSGFRARTLIATLLLGSTLIPMAGMGVNVAYVTIGFLVCIVTGWIGSYMVGDGVSRLAARLLRIARSAVVSPNPALFAVGCACLSFFACLGASTFLMEGAPGVIDDALYFMQAKIFAGGECTAPAPPIGDFFSTPYAINDGGRWYTQYPPGYPAILSIGVRFGLEHWINPLVVGLTAPVAYALGRRTGASDLEARVGALIVGLCPLTLIMASDLSSHPSSTLFFTLAALATALGMRSRPVPWFLLAGLCAGVTVTIRPYTSAALLLPLGVLGVVHVTRTRSWLAGATTLLGFALPVALLLLYNARTTGDPLLLGYVKLHGSGHVPGFGATVWGEHTPTLGLVNSILNLNCLNKDFLQCPFPGLLPAAVLFALGRPNRWDLVYLLTILSLVGFYFCYSFQSLYLGPKFLYESCVPLALLSAKGFTLIDGIVRGWAQSKRRARQLALTIGAILAVGIASTTYKCSRVRELYSDPTIVRVVAEQGIDHAIVFASDDGPRFVACFAKNAPTWDGPVVFAQDLGERNRELLAHYPGRTAYRWSNERQCLEPLERLER